MGEVLNAEQIQVYLDLLLDWVNERVFTPEMGQQMLIAFGVFVIALIFSRPVHALFHRMFDVESGKERVKALSQFADELDDLALPIVWALFQWASVYIADEFGYPTAVLSIIANLVTAWIVIRFVSGFVKSPTWSRVVAFVAWSIAALNILDLLEPTRVFLASLGLSLGEVRISALSVVEGAISLVILLWAANFTTRLIDQQVENSNTLTPSVKVLISKVSKIALIALAILLAMGGAGIDLTALTIFSGALGIGIGFGLQKIVANFISGIILLLDKSVKPGDNIVVANTFGWIDKLNARYVSVITRDGTEHLIPNEDLITQRVENWSYTNRLLRVRMPVGVSYNSDLHLAMKLCVEAANECDRIIAHPEPKCQLRGFGDNSVDLEIRAWIEDPQNGRGGVINDCLLKVWDKFHEHGIEFPYPQRDIHIKTIDGQIESALAAGD